MYHWCVIISDEKIEVNEIETWDTDEKFPHLKGWEAIGFHRPLAGELWEVSIEMLENVLYIFIIVILVPLLMPFPDLHIIIGQHNRTGIYILVCIGGIWARI